MRTLLKLELEEECWKTETSVPTIIPTKQWVVDNEGRPMRRFLSGEEGGLAQMVALLAPLSAVHELGQEKGHTWVWM